MFNDCKSCGARVSSVFVNLNGEELAEVSSHTSCVSLSRGEMLFEEGSTPRGVYCIHSGHFKLVRYNKQGKEQIIRFASKGDSLGYAPVISQHTFTTSAVAVEPSNVCFIPTSLIQSTLAKNPEFSLSVLRHLSGEVRVTEDRVVELAQKSVRERVAEALLVIRTTFGTEADGQTLNNPLTREEIAGIVGTAPESLIRMLSELKAEKLIDTQGRKIRLLNPLALARQANLYQDH